MGGYIRRHIVEVTVFGTVMLIHCAAALIWLWRKRDRDFEPHHVGLAAAGLAVSGCLMLATLASTSGRLTALVPAVALFLVRTIGIAWVLCSLLGLASAAILLLVPRPKPHHDPSRRRLLTAIRGAVIAGPAVALGYGTFIERRGLKLREVDLPIPGLPKDLHGLRIAQVTDIHLGPYLSRGDLRRAVDMANETNPHIALVTGDLITARGDPLSDCIAEVRRLRAEAGIYGCHGNHEVYANCLEEATREGARAGIEFLRHTNRVIRFAGTSLNLVGVDYQRFYSPYLTGVERLVQPGMPNILLSHNPDVFRVAAAKGFDATISGHTHGGQVTMEILDQNLSIARFYTPYIYGLYSEGRSSVYVGRGIGTVGVPVRIGAPPEVALIRLCAT